ncbi:peptidase inhibitor family I36 protein [Streptomyces lydicus]|nr:peptidase inhibitor family I36 protein [Streptomyces lydicus]
MRWQAAGAAAQSRCRTTGGAVHPRRRHTTGRNPHHEHPQERPSAPRPHRGRRGRLRRPGPRPGRRRLRRARPAHTQQGSVTLQRAPGNCPRGYLCVYPKPNYKGTPKKVAGNNRDLRRYGGAFNHPWSAFNNGTRCNVTVYERPNYRGGHAKLNRGTGWAYIGGNIMTIYSDKWC